MATPAPPASQTTPGPASQSTPGPASQSTPGPASQSTPASRTTPEYLTLRKSYMTLVHEISTQPRDICGVLFEKGLVPTRVLSYVGTDAIPSDEKAYKIVDTILAKVESDPSNYPVFVSALKKVGHSIDSLVKQLEKNHLEQVDPSSTSENSKHSLSNPDASESVEDGVKSKPKDVSDPGPSNYSRQSHVDDYLYDPCDPYYDRDTSSDNDEASDNNSHFSDPYDPYEDPFYDPLEDPDPSYEDPDPSYEDPDPYNDSLEDPFGEEIDELN